MEMIPVVLNGVNQSVPETDETDWGTDATSLLQDLAFVLNGTFQAVTAAGGTTNIDFDNGRNVDLTLNSSTTIVLASPRVGMPCVFQIFQAGGNTIAWPANIRWRGGRSPVHTLTAGGVDVVCLLYNSVRGIYLGEYALNFA